MPESQNNLISRYTNSMCEQLRDGAGKIEHCVAQLNHEQLWWRPHESMNSTANLILHLTGNLKQWLIVGLTDQSDLRKRQTEFDDRSERTAEELMPLLQGVIGTACETIQKQTENELLQVRRVQQFDVDGFQTIADSVCHFRGHVQEIIHLTRVQLGDDYQFDFVPEKPD